MSILKTLFKIITNYLLFITNTFISICLDEASKKLRGIFDFTKKSNGFLK